MKRPGVLTRASLGDFNPSDWRAEGESLLLSARVLRLKWVQNHRELRRRLRSNSFGSDVTSDLYLDQIERSLTKSSVLLMGYAVEMFLKSGLARALHGCDEDLLAGQVKEFSHNYIKLAEFIRFPMSQEERGDLCALTDAVQFDGRYPVTVNQGEDYFSKYNARYARLKDGRRFKRYRVLARSIYLHALGLAGHGRDFMYFKRFNVDDDGYVCYRTGGVLPPRLTFKLSSKLLEEGIPAALTILKQSAIAEIPELVATWDMAEKYEHKSGKTAKMTLCKNDSFMAAPAP